MKLGTWKKIIRTTYTLYIKKSGLLYRIESPSDGHGNWEIYRQNHLFSMASSLREAKSRVLVDYHTWLDGDQA